MINSNSLRRQVERCLANRDYMALINLSKQESRVFTVLRSSLYATDEAIRWPSIEAVGWLMHSWWLDGRKEKVRDYIRRLMWSMSDESGEIGWSAPQVVAETISATPELLEPYGSMMIGRAFCEPMLVKSGLWAVGRLDGLIKDVVLPFQDDILKSFHSDDTETLGLVAWAAGGIRLHPALPFLEHLEKRQDVVRIYIQSRFCGRPLGDWAKEATAAILSESADCGS